MWKILKTNQKLGYKITMQFILTETEKAKLHKKTGLNWDETDTLSPQLIECIARYLPTSTAAKNYLRDNDSNLEPDGFSHIVNVLTHHKKLGEVKPWLDTILKNNNKINQLRLDSPNSGMLTILEAAFALGNSEAFIYLWNHPDKIPGVNHTFSIKNIRKLSRFSINTYSNIHFINTLINQKT